MEALLAQKRQVLAVKEMLLEGTGGHNMHDMHLIIWLVDAVDAYLPPGKEEQSLTAGPVPCGSPLYVFGLQWKWSGNTAQ